MTVTNINHEKRPEHLIGSYTYPRRYLDAFAEPIRSSMYNNFVTK